MSRILPDLLSIARVPCAVLFIAIYDGTDRRRFTIALGIITIALITDFLDGALARRLGVSSKHGYILDGLGDRAVYVALFLAFLVQQEIGMVVTWLLVFREIAIYAVRLFSGDWFEVSRSVRFMSLLHAGLIRLWILSVLARHALALYADLSLEERPSLFLIPHLLLASALVVSYYSLTRHLSAIVATADF